MAASEKPLRVTYDEAADAAYIYLSEIGEGQITRTVPAGGPAGNRDEINLDFDGKGVMRGIEVLGASRILPKVILEDQ